jgi:hypothetical protein
MSTNTISASAGRGVRQTQPGHGHGEQPAGGAATTQPMRAPFLLSVLLAASMLLQAGLGLTFPERYRDVGYVRETWFGNDLVTLLVAVPILVAALLLERRGFLLGRLLWLGALGYGVYNGAFYLFGAALNAFLPLYIAMVVVAAVAMILALSRSDVAEVAAGFRARTPVRLIGGYLVFVAAGLTVVWLVMWAAHVFGGQPTPIETEAFKLVAALDLTLMVPALASGGVLLWRRRPWGYVIAAVAGIQGSMYLLVLALNAVLFVVRGLTEGAGELPVWAGLAVATTAATLCLLVNVGAARATTRSPQGWTRSATRGGVAHDHARFSSPGSESGARG